MDSDFFVDRWLRLKLQAQLPLARFRDRQGRVAGQESLFDDGHFHRFERRRNNRNSVGIRSDGFSADRDFSARHRDGTNPYLNAHRGSRRLAECRNCSTEQKEKSNGIKSEQHQQRRAPVTLSDREMSHVWKKERQARRCQ